MHTKSFYEYHYFGGLNSKVTIKWLPTVLPSNLYWFNNRIAWVHACCWSSSLTVVLKKNFSVWVFGSAVPAFLGLWLLWRVQEEVWVCQRLALLYRDIWLPQSLCHYWWQGMYHVWAQLYRDIWLPQSLCHYWWQGMCYGSVQQAHILTASRGISFCMLYCWSTAARAMITWCCWSYLF